jgi:hypothetical protein
MAILTFPFWNDPTVTALLARGGNTDDCAPVNGHSLNTGRRVDPGSADKHSLLQQNRLSFLGAILPLAEWP